MKILLFAILLFTFANIVSAQPIFIALTGERAITKVKDIKDVDITKMGKPCGDYFLYEEAKNTDGTFRRVLSFKVPVTNQDASTSIPNGFIRTLFEKIIIKLDYKIDAPTAEWGMVGPVGRMNADYLIRISPKDESAASCLVASP